MTAVRNQFQALMQAHTELSTGIAEANPLLHSNISDDSAECMHSEIPYFILKFV